jgi:tRNA/rRNA methyltransferase
MAIQATLDRLRLVLVSARNPLNIGAAARAMSNFGCSHLRAVNPYEASFREARSAVGASDVLAAAEEFKTVAEAVADCTLVIGTTAVRHRDLQHTVRRLEDGARLIRKRLASSRVALLFGSEKFGLSNDDMSHCHWLLRIPTHEQNISMNLGQAAAVCLYELIRDPRPAGPPKSGGTGSQSRSDREESGAKPRGEKLPLAAAAEVERFTEVLLENLFASGYLTRRRVADAELRIRRLVRRLNLPARDAVIWVGIMRQLLWKMKSGSDPQKGA